jgi:hypothetical protein
MSMSVVTEALPASRRGVVARLNTTAHEKALWVFGAIVIAHWAEHLAQAFQIGVLGLPRPEALGVLGMWFPGLVSSEWLHYGYALVMLALLLLLLPGMQGRARTFWLVALAIQVWHFVEHGLLLYQAQFHHNLFGGANPTSVLQAAFTGARVEIHFFYNTLVTIPMVISLIYHMYPPRPERREQHSAGVEGPSCSCARV